MGCLPSAPTAGPPGDLRTVLPGTFAGDWSHRPVYALVWQDQTQALYWTPGGWVPDTEGNRPHAAVPLRLAGDRVYGPSPLPAGLPPGDYFASFHLGLASGPPDPTDYDFGGLQLVRAYHSPTGLGCTIAAAAAGPESATLPDGRSVTARPLPDLIEADQYLHKKAAAAWSPWAFVRRATAVPPGAV